MSSHRGELVSVVVPAYNAESTIYETLESARAQTYTELEVIVVDDGSSDATAEIVAGLASGDHRIRLLRQANAGVAAARNSAIAASRGAYVAPLDADDLWHPEKIALQVEAMQRGGPRVGVVHCWWRKINATGRIIGRDRMLPAEVGSVYLAVLLGNVPGNGSAPLIRRKLLVEVGGYDAGLRSLGAQGCEDLMLYVELAERCEFALVPKFLVGYRMAAGNMSSHAQRMTRSHQIVLQRARDRRPDLPAHVFRMATARAQFSAAQRYARKGMPISALVALWGGLTRDPLAAVYKSMEALHRLVCGSGQPSAEVEGQPFLAVSPEPPPDCSSVSSPFLRRYAAYATATAAPAPTDRSSAENRPGWS